MCLGFIFLFFIFYSSVLLQDRDLRPEEMEGTDTP